jgi:hypothetical protein
LNISHILHENVEGCVHRNKCKLQFQENDLFRAFYGKF